MRVFLAAPSSETVYARAAIRGATSGNPPLGLACLAGALQQAGHQVRVMDGQLEPDPLARLKRRLEAFRPDWLGISFTTPQWPAAVALARAARERLPGIRIVIGGHHASSLPEESLRRGDFDAAVVGEGEETLIALLAHGGAAVPGAWVRDRDGRIHDGGPRPYISDLDRLPLPALEALPLRRYNCTGVLSRSRLAVWLETSRGCPAGCVYCSKAVFGRRFRFKTPARVVEEMELAAALGAGEIHIADDNFTASPRRAEQICEMILQQGLTIPWATVTGIRVDRATPTLLRKMRRAGCYRIYIGIESGSQYVLDQVDKGISIEQVRHAVAHARAADLEVVGFFMIALPGEDEDAARQTLRLSRELDLDLAKMAITIPLPGTPLYRRLQDEGALKQADWTAYNLYAPARTIYDHPNMDWDTIERLYREFYVGFFARPDFLVRRLARAARGGTLFSELGALWTTARSART